MFVFAAHTDQNGANPTQELANLKQASTQSVDDIAQSVFNPELLPPGTTTIPLGDAAPQQPIQDVTADFQRTMSDLDALDKDVDDAQLEGAKSPESLRSFDGLKARYKNKIQAFRNQITNLNTTNTALAEQLKELPKIKDNATKYEEIAPEVQKLEATIEDLKKENESLNYYRRKYDLEKDPYIQQEYLEPMTSMHEKSMDILRNNNLDEDFWKELTSCDSEFKMNSMIDNARISGLNGQSLKRYVTAYQQLKGEFNQASSPDTIESAIDMARGRRIQDTSVASEKIFGYFKHAFSDWMKEIQESEVNREHNFYVHDAAVDTAKKTYESLRRSIPSEHLTQGVLEVFAKSALMSAAYPLQRKMLDHALKIVGELQAARVNGAPSMRQIRENPPASTSINTETIKQAATKSIDDIARESFQNSSF